LTVSRLQFLFENLPEMIMQRLKTILLALCATVLLAVSISGCAQMGYMQGHTQNVDCRSCHTSSGAAGARDFSHIYADPSSHHPVGIKYPAGLNANKKFNLPNARSADIAFFDRNGNGQPDSDEILLFGAGGAATVECSSCHKAHGNDPAPANITDKFYLRVDNAGSALCITCHSY